MRALLGGTRRPIDEDNYLNGLRAFGATEKELEEVRAALEQRRRTAVFEVWPENWRAWELFQGMGTSWQTVLSPNGRLVYLGLQWGVLDSIERRLPPEHEDDVPDPRTLFYQLRTLESEALEVRNAG